jgi:hypothetical protein
MSRDLVLSRLQQLTAERPVTKMGQIRSVWPEIQQALAAGHTLQRVHECLGEAGIEIGYRTLSLYLGRLKREQPPDAIRHGNKVPGKSNFLSDFRSGPPRNDPAGDPFANIRREREKRHDAAFEYDAFSTNKRLLE